MKLQIYWEITHTHPSLGSNENGQKKRKYSARAVVEFLNITRVTRSQSSLKHIWYVVEQEIHILDKKNYVYSIWTKISKKCFQHLVESIPPLVLKAKGGPPHNDVAGECR